MHNINPSMNSQSALNTTLTFCILQKKIIKGFDCSSPMMVIYGNILLCESLTYLLHLLSLCFMQNYLVQ